MRADSIEIHIPLMVPDSIACGEGIDMDTASHLMMCNDSVFGCFEPPSVARSLFKELQAVPREPEGKLRQNEMGGDWIFAVIVGLFIIISLYMNNMKIKMREIVMSLFDIRVLERVYREYNLRIFNLIPMTIIYLAGLSLAVLSMAGLWGGEPVMPEASQFFLMVFVVLVAYLFLKMTLSNLLGNVFDDSDVTRMYTINSLMFNLLTTIISTVVLLPMYYMPGAREAMVYLYVFVVGMMFIVRVFRGLQLILTHSVGMQLYIFYYLCILEIAPIIVVIKYIIK